MKKDFVDPRFVSALEVNNAGRGRRLCFLEPPSCLQRGIKFRRSFYLDARRLEFYR
jgi:hypothetical protein